MSLLDRLFGGSDWNFGVSEYRAMCHAAWLARGRRWGGRLVIEDEKLADRPFHGLDHSYARFVRCDLSRLRLSWKSFDHAELIDCQLEGAELWGTRLDGATIEGCTFDRSEPHDAWFTGAAVRRSSMAHAGLVASKWTNAKVSNASFEGARFGHAVLTGAHFIDCNLRDADLRTEKPGRWAARFERCDFRGAKLEEHQRKEAVFVECTFDRQDGGYR